MKFKKNYLVISIIVVMLIMILLYFKVKNTSIEAEYLNYLLEVDIQEITLTNNLDNDAKILDESDLKKIFSKLDNYGIKKVFSEVLKDEAEYTLSVYYLINGDGHYFIVNDNRINISNDEKLMNLLNNNYEYNDYDESTSDETTTYYFAFDNYKEKVFSKYFNK